MGRQASIGLVRPEAGHHDQVTKTAVSNHPIDWLFRNRETGRITIVQMPNVPLIAFALFRLMELVFSPHGDARGLLHLVGTVALAWWAADELLRGVNPFRRVLGAGALIVVLIDLLA